eukprot:SAG31_NODE_1705_length_7491_cov_3.705222_2_plen_78_part_00
MLVNLIVEMLLHVTVALKKLVFELHSHMVLNARDLAPQAVLGSFARLLTARVRSSSRYREQRPTGSDSRMLDVCYEG